MEFKGLGLRDFEEYASGGSIGSGLLFRSSEIVIVQLLGLGCGRLAAYSGFLVSGSGLCLGV